MLLLRATRSITRSVSCFISCVPLAIDVPDRDRSVSQALAAQHELSLRSYATMMDSQNNNPGPVKSSPVSSKASRTPFFLAGAAVCFVGGYYSFHNPVSTSIPDYKNIDITIRVKPATDWLRCILHRSHHKREPLKQSTGRWRPKRRVSTRVLPWERVTHSGCRRNDGPQEGMRIETSCIASTHFVPSGFCVQPLQLTYPP